ncbi:MAG: glycosyltransferase family 4 protein [Bacteroidales bacterium]|jgi:glycosyltransferase involved in cell wall biosynthesis|nr:glycosyltransferase family 4 protein [Bacteroidales bacterium]
MKKVLIITYYWPPSGGGGVQRWLKFVKYLRDFGWEPVIYTPENPESPQIDQSLVDEIPAEIEVIKTRVWEPYRWYKAFTGRKSDERIQTAFLSEKKKPGMAEKLSIWIRGNVFIPDARRFWIKPSVRFLKKWLQSNPVDLIVTTGPPHSMHLIAMQLKEKTGIMWLADFRDPWTNIDYYQDLMLGKRADRKHHQLELKVLKNADAVTVVSPGMSKEFTEIYNRNYAVIPNGFDTSDFKKTEKLNPESGFSLAHIGALVKTRNPLILWKVLNELCKESDAFSADLKIKLIGNVDVFVRESLQANELMDKLEILPYLPHEEVVIEQMRAQVLLLLINRTPNAHLILTGKLFEYMGAGRPILGIGPVAGDAAAILKETGAGVMVDFEEEEKLKHYIRSFYQKFQNGSLINSPEDIYQYSRYELTRKMANEFDRITSR